MSASKAGRTGKRQTADGTPKPRPAKPDRLRVLTMNIQVGMQTAHYGHYVTGAWRHVLPSRGVRANLDRIAELVSRFDLVALQEADAGSLRTGQINQVEYLAQRAGFAHWHVAVNRNLGPFAQHCLGFLSRQPLLDPQHYPLPGRVPGRGALSAMLAMPGVAPVQVVVTHLALNRGWRQRQLDYIAALTENDSETILLGDLNCEAEELVSYGSLTRLGLQPIVGEATFPSWRPQRRIDHVLATPGLRVAHTHVVPTPLSDHLAVAAELHLPRLGPARRK